MNSDLFTARARTAWKAVRAQADSRLSAEDVDLLFAHYVLGLTSPLHGDDDPAAHLGACRAVLAHELTPDRVERALHAVPAASGAWAEKAFRSIEMRGVQDGRALLEQEHGANGAAETEPSDLV